jgi:hypothetical protein
MKMSAEDREALLKFSRELDRIITDGRFRQAAVARAAEISAGYLNDILRVGKGNSDKLFRLQRDKVVRIAQAIEWDVSDALECAGFRPLEQAPKASGLGARLLRLFDALPAEKQEDLLIYAEAMFRKHGVPSELRGVKDLGGEERQMPVVKANQSTPPAAGGRKQTAKKKRAA